LTTYTTREAWLIDALEALREDVFAEHELEIPPYRVSVGFPGGRGKKANVVGQCWNTSQTEDGTATIFVHPSVKDPVTTLAILCHEAIHAIDDCASGHKGAFSKMFRLIGMVGKRTECDFGEELAAKLEKIAAKLGPYPHSALKRQPSRTKVGEKPDGTRMKKVVCLDEACGYILRTTQKWIDVGFPTCVCGGEMDVAG
jgi:hypothetical protein